MRWILVSCFVLAACGSKSSGTCALATEGMPCASPGECCSNSCEGTCGATGSCSANGLSCGDSSDCCSGACVDGACEPASCQGLGATCVASATCCSGRCEGGECLDNAGCLPVQASCTNPTDCCSGRCQSGVCLPSGSCLAPGTACTAGPTNECCSSRCEPLQGMTGVTQCTNFCRGNGATCTKATDCCDLNCNGGTCGGAICSVQADGCANNAQCCSNICNNMGECELDPANTTCRGIGETCTSGPQRGCCSMVCDETQDPPRCDFGADTCAAQNASCMVDADCCHGVCDPSTMTCKTPCVPTGSTCTTNVDCCSSVCTNGTCGTPPGCQPIGVGCTVDAECCTGLCIGGFCDLLL